MTIRINRTLDGVEMICSGTVYGEEILNAHAEMFPTQSIPLLRYALIDKSGVDKYWVKTDEVVVLSELDKAVADINPSIVIAMLVPESLQKLAELWREIAARKGINSYVFTSRDDAEKCIEKHTSHKN